MIETEFIREVAEIYDYAVLSYQISKADFHLSQIDGLKQMLALIYRTSKENESL